MTRLAARLVFGVAFTAIVGAAAAAVAQTPLPQTATPPPQVPAGQPTFRTRGEGVRIDVLVTDGDRPVTGLTAKDFELIDSGVRQQVDVESLADTPVDLILVLDTSTSLQERGLAHLARAADALLARLRPRDRAGLVTFSEDVIIRAALTPQHVRVRAMLRDLKLHGSTSVIDAAYAGMVLNGGERPTMLLVFSDGMDTVSWLRPKDVLDSVRHSGVVPYAVVAGEGVGSFVLPLVTADRRIERLRPNVDEVERFLGDLVRAGGGVFLNAEDTRQLEQRFGEALDSFRQRYVLTYAPQGVERPGWHPVTIRVKGHGDYRIRARPGYLVR